MTKGNKESLGSEWSKDGGINWTAILWDDEEDPTFVKTRALEAIKNRA